MRRALQLARRGYGRTSPNPMVGAVLVRGERELGAGWHHAAGLPHAEIEALTDARRRRHRPARSCLYVTLGPCSTHGRTPPCTEAILAAGISRVVVGATDPNPAHGGRGLELLQRAGVEVVTGVLEAPCRTLNEAFNHWIVHRTPWVTLKSAMTLDGRIADSFGHSRWITGAAARRHAHHLRAGVDAILVGINTILADNPALTARTRSPAKPLRRVILDSQARTPIDATVLNDDYHHLTLLVTSRRASSAALRRLRDRVEVWTAPLRHGRIDLRWLLKRLGGEGVTSLLVEGGGEVNGAFLDDRLAHRIAFFYAPKLLLAASARPALAGRGASSWAQVPRLREVEWRRFGTDLFLTALVAPPAAH